MPGTRTTSLPANAAPIAVEELAAGAERFAERAVAHLDDVAEQHQAVGTGGGDRLEQALADRRPPQHVAAGAGAQVGVGDQDGRRHRGNPRNSDRRAAASGSPPAPVRRRWVDSPAGHGERDVNGRPRPHDDQRSRNRGRESCDRRDARDRPRSRRRRGRGARRGGARGAARLVAGRLRRARRGADEGPRLDGRQRRPHRRVDLRRDRQARRRDDVRRARLRDLGARVLGEAGAGDARRRDRRERLAVGPRRPRAQGPLRAGRRRRRDRALELPADQLLRRLHPGARSRQRGRPQAVGGDAADLAADGRDARRGGPARRRLRGRHRRRRDRRGARRPRRLRDVHRLGRDRQEGDGAGRRDADPGQPRARRQGPDDRPRRRRYRARRQRRRLLRAQQQRPGLHLGRADLRRGRDPRRVRRPADRQGRVAAAGAARRARQRRRRRDHLPAAARADRIPCPRRRRARRRGADRGPGRRGAGALLRADRPDRRRSLDALHDRGDLRADAAGDAGRRRRRGGRAGQRGPLRTAGLGLDARHGPRRASSPGGSRLGSPASTTPSSTTRRWSCRWAAGSSRGWARATAPTGSASTPAGSRSSSPPATRRLARSTCSPTSAR